MPPKESILQWQGPITCEKSIEKVDQKWLLVTNRCNFTGVLAETIKKLLQEMKELNDKKNHFKGPIRLIARITSSIQASFILYVFSKDTKPQISFKKVDVTDV